MTGRLFLFLVASTLALACADGATRVLASGRIPADTLDSEGETIGGIGSALELVPGGVVMLSDRGAGDGTMDYRPRLQFFAVKRDGASLGFTHQQTVLLRDSNGRAFTGLFPDRPSASPPQRADGRMCLDPEGLALAPNGNFYIAEEYMPSVREFGPDGGFVRRFGIPDDLIPTGGKGADFATDERMDLVSGREPNRGLEGLALLPDGRLAAILQSGLVQDGGRKAGFTRLVVFDAAGGEPTAAYRVPFAEAAELDASAPVGKTIEPKHLVFSALSALPDGRLLALERESFGADGSGEFPAARYKAVVLLDLTGAGNMLEHGGTAEPVRRTTLFNLAALDTASVGLPREAMPAKWEGLAVSGADEGRLRLLLSSDNDFLTPVLKLKNGDAAAADVPFPRAERTQDTWVIEVETPLPPAQPSASRNEQKPSAS